MKTLGLSSRKGRLTAAAHRFSRACLSWQNSLWLAAIARFCAPCIAGSKNDRGSVSERTRHCVCMQLAAWWKSWRAAVVVMMRTLHESVQEHKSTQSLHQFIVRR